MQFISETKLTNHVQSYYNKTHKNGSIVQYIYCYRTLCAALAPISADDNIDNYIIDPKWLVGPKSNLSKKILDDIVTYCEILGTQSLTKQSSMYNSIVRVFEAYATRKDNSTLKRFYTLSNESRVRSNEERLEKSQQPTEKQVEISNGLQHGWDDIVAQTRLLKEKHWDSTDINDFNKYLIAELYGNQLPPGRLENYVEHYLVTGDDDLDDVLHRSDYDFTNNPVFNYTDLSKGIIYMNTFKTVKSMGPQTITLPPSLIEALTIYKKRFNSRYVLSLPKGVPMSNVNSVSTRLREAFKPLGSDISVGHLRKIYVAHYHNKLSMAENIEMSRQMLHSWLTHCRDYMKLKDIPAIPTSPKVNDL